MRFFPAPLSGEWEKGDKVFVFGKEAIIEDIKGGTLEIRYMTESPETTTRDGIEFDEDLYLYKAQMYDSDMNQEYERYIVAIDFEDATAIAKAYFEDKCVSVTGIWQVDIVIGRYYE